MTPSEITLSRALGECRFPPATAHKRFARQMAQLAEEEPYAPISPAQARHLCILAWRYRHQLPAAILELALDLGETVQPIADAQMQAAVHKRAQLRRAAQPAPPNKET